LKTESLPQMPVDELRSRIDEHSELQIIDVRRPAEYAAGHIPGAVNAELSHIQQTKARFDPARPSAVACASGYRSSIAASILARSGFRDLFNVVGGTEAWTAAKHPLERT
jgi:hydroxyacylglutathione hydrolase